MHNRKQRKTFTLIETILKNKIGSSRERVDEGQNEEGESGKEEERKGERRRSEGKKVL